MPRPMEHHPAPAGMAPGNGYSHVVAATGRIVAVAGQVALDAAGNLVGEDDPEAQVRQVFDNIGTALAAAGSSFADVIKLTYFLTDSRSCRWSGRSGTGTWTRSARPRARPSRWRASVRKEFLLEVEALAVVSD